MEDKTLVCRDCGNEFVWTVGEQEFYQSKGFDQAPTRCPDCRKLNKQNKMHGRGGNGGERVMHDAICSECGKETKVPFEPREGKPVYCNECFAKRRDQANG